MAAALAVGPARRSALLVAGGFLGDEAKTVTPPSVTLWTPALVFAGVTSAVAVVVEALTTPGWTFQCGSCVTTVVTSVASLWLYRGRPREAGALVA